MTEEQINICELLGVIATREGSFDRSMTKTLARIARETPEKELSENQREWMFRLLYKYRIRLPGTYKKHKDNPHCSPNGGRISQRDEGKFPNPYKRG